MLYAIWSQGYAWLLIRFILYNIFNLQNMLVFQLCLFQFYIRKLLWNPKYDFIRKLNIYINKQQTMKQRKVLVGSDDVTCHMNIKWNTELTTSPRENPSWVRAEASLKHLSNVCFHVNLTEPSITETLSAYTSADRSKKLIGDNGT